MNTSTDHISETIKRLREQHAVKIDVPRFSQGKLAAALGVDRNTVTGWEKPGANVPTDQRLRLARFFDVDPSVLGVEDVMTFTASKPPPWFTHAMEQQQAQIAELTELVKDIKDAIQ